MMRPNTKLYLVEMVRIKQVESADALREREKRMMWCWLYSAVENDSKWWKKCSRLMLTSIKCMMNGCNSFLNNCALVFFPCSFTWHLLKLNDTTDLRAPKTPHQVTPQQMFAQCNNIVEAGFCGCRKKKLLDFVAYSNGLNSWWNSCELIMMPKMKM